MVFNLLNVVLIGAISAVAGYALWQWVFRIDQELVAKRRSFAHVASLLRAGNPDSWFARIFDDLAFHDVDDLIETAFEGAALIESDPQVLFAEFDHQFYNVLEGKAKDPAQLALIQSEITKATAPVEVKPAA